MPYLEKTHFPLTEQTSVKSGELSYNELKFAKNINTIYGDLNFFRTLSLYNILYYIILLLTDL